MAKCLHIAANNRVHSPTYCLFIRKLKITHTDVFEAIFICQAQAHQKEKILKLYIWCPFSH